MSTNFDTKISIEYFFVGKNYEKIDTDIHEAE